MSPIVYLHGFASSPASRKAAFFRDRFRERGVEIATPDLDGGDFEHLTITGQLSILDRAAGGRPASLIGSSMGGYLAALYAARHPEVSKLVLLAPAFAFPTRWPEALGAAAMEAWRRTGKRAVYHYASGAPRILDYALIEDGRRYEDFPDFRQPGLIFHGTGDDVVPSFLSEQFAASHPNVELRLMPSGHELTDVLDPMWEAIQTFLL